MYDNPWADVAYAPQPRRLGQPPKISDRLKYAAEVTKEKTKVAAKKVKKGASKSWKWMKNKFQKKKETNAYQYDF